ncbi:hypothetical protein CMU94_01905 [Elizabethkingia anophelis]|nr:hypothetical protein [Elizabethkingia anophelis]
MLCTIYRDIFDFKSPHKIEVIKCLERIRDGKSKDIILKLRSEEVSEKQDAIKKTLPAIVFSGVFAARRDDAVKEYSNLIILDFDYVNDIESLRNKLINFPSTVSVWTSPRGNGLKCLIRILDGKNHRQHFEALKLDFPDVDPSGINISRVCFESYDPNIFININANVYKKLVVEEIKKETITSAVDSDSENYIRLKKWLENKSEAFASGNRNNYIFKLASSCCRFGLPEYSTLDFILRDYATSNFSQSEIKLTVKSAYRSNKMGSASFEKNEFVSTTNKKLIEVSELDENYEEFSHIIFGDDVKRNFMDIYFNGYEKLVGINCPLVDHFFKLKRGEVTLFSGYANLGKSTYLTWYCLNRAILHGEKWAFFSPESYPAEEFYLELVEMLAGCDITPNNKNRPSEEIIAAMYEFVTSHFFYVYPEKVKPTFKNLKESFLEIIIKHNVDGVVIDPFNQIAHDRSGIAREDFYLEEIFSDTTKFANENNIYFIYVAHPTKEIEVNGKGDFKAPTMYKISGGSMWANKMHNILIYHRPYARSIPDDPRFTLTSEKIKKKKITGKGGTFEGSYMLNERRFKIPIIDPVTRLPNPDKVYDPLKTNMNKVGLFKEKEIEENKIELPRMSASQAFESPILTPEEQDEQFPF